ncbi:MAG TPA: hypothetical protein VF556_02240 [Pyrinomonadaceae bacterium]|jgi:DNA-binding CsgD family transcriptional regulator/predicted XRE-type DNA-binding protein
MNDTDETSIRDEIVSLYVKGATLEKIGEAYKMSRQGVQYHLKKAGVERRTYQEATAIKRTVIDEKVLRELYLNQQLTYAEMERRLGVTKYEIVENLKIYNILRRSKEQTDFTQRRKTRQLDRDTLHRLYIEQRLRTREIAVLYGISQPRVSALLVKYKLNKGKGRHKLT